jgi:hypothetical protein
VATAAVEVVGVQGDKGGKSRFNLCERRVAGQAGRLHHDDVCMGCVPKNSTLSGWGWARFGCLLFPENRLKHMTGASHRDCFEPHPDNGGSPDSFLPRRGHSKFR